MILWSYIVVVCVLFVSYEILFIFWAHDSRGRNDQNKQIMPIVVEIHQATYVLLKMHQTKWKIKKGNVLADLRPFCSEPTLAIDVPSKTPTAFCSKGVGPGKGSIL